MKENCVGKLKLYTKFSGPKNSQKGDVKPSLSGFILSGDQTLH